MHFDRSWARQPPPAGHVRSVLVVIHGFFALDTEPRLVSWDGRRMSVRTATGRLRWYEDDAILAFRDESDRIRSVEIATSPAYPLHYRTGSRDMDAAAVCSLADLADVADLGRVEVVTEDEVLALDFPGEPGSFAKVWLSPGGVVHRADGFSSGKAWRLEVLEESVASSDVLLRVEDVDLPPRWKASLPGPK